MRAIEIAQFRQQAILNLSARERDRVRDAMKSDHRIFGHEMARIFGFQGELDFLSEEKPGIRDAIAHFDEVFQGHVRDGIRVELAGLFEFLE